MDDPNKRPTIQQVVLSLRSIISQDDDEITQIIPIIHAIKTSEKFSYSMSIDNEFDDFVISDYLLDNLDTENEILPYILKRAEKLFNEIIDLKDSVEIVIDKLIILLIKIQDKKGYNFAKTSQFISQCINLAQRKISDWLIDNQTESQYIFFLGFLYYNGIIVEKNANEAFKLFSKASEDNYSMAQVYLSKCYQTGIGTEINYDLAIIIL